MITKQAVKRLINRRALELKLKYIKRFRFFGPLSFQPEPSIQHFCNMRCAPAGLGLGRTCQGDSFTAGMGVVSTREFLRRDSGHASWDRVEHALRVDHARIWGH